MSAGKPDAGMNAAEGVVWDVGYLGDMTIFNVKLKDGKVVKTAQLNATRTSDEPLSYDDPVWISFAPDSGMVLTSGEAMQKALSAVLNRLVIAIPYAWLAFFFLAPFVIVFKISFSTTAIAMPPYIPVLDWSGGFAGFVDKFRQFTTFNYEFLWRIRST